MSTSRMKNLQTPPSLDGKPPQAELDRMFDSGQRLATPDFGSRFSVARKISSGGMSDVYAALDTESGNKVALKIASSSNAPLELTNRFIERESLALKKLNHPNVVSLFGKGESDGRNYLVLEFVEGENLDERIRRGPLGWPEAKGILGGLCDALSAVHASGAVHCDFTANNVSLSPTGGEGERPVLLDFGFVKFRDPLLNAGRTPDGDTVLGTFKYLAPEQVFRAVSTDFDHRADIYAFGVLAYRMVSGSYPFDGPSNYSILIKHRDQHPKPLEGLPNLPPEADRIILKALAKDPNQRFQSAGELRSELEKAF